MAEELTREQVIEKAKKLFAVSEGTNFENEAKVALNKMRDLLAKYNLSMGDIDGNHSERNPEFKLMTEKTGYWQGSLATVVANFCNCTAFYTTVSKSRVLRVIGMPHEVEICTFTFSHIAEQIDKLMRKKRKELRAQRQREGRDRQDRQASSYFTRGYVDGIIIRLKQRLDDRLNDEAGGKALVLVQHPKVKDWVDKNIGRSLRKSRQQAASEEGFQQGFRDGDKVNIHRGLGHKDKKRLS